jgi:hypothetical protein
MFKQLLEAVDANTEWRVFRHVKTAGDVFAYFRGWVWIATGVGAVISYVWSSPWYVKFLLALVSIVVVLVGALVWKLLRSAPASNDEPLPQTNRGKVHGIAKTIVMVFVIILAIVVSSKFPLSSSRATTPAPLPAPKGNTLLQELSEVYARRDYANRLGKPLPGRTVPVHDVYQVKHRKAMVIWLDDHFFQVSTAGNPKWIEREQVNGANRPELRTDAGCRKLFPDILPNPPFSGVALLFKNDPDTWRWIGSREWHCYLDNSKIRYQRFEHGMIIAGLRHKSEDSPDPQDALVLIDDGPWHIEPMEGSPPACNTPEEDLDAKRHRIKHGNP